MHRRAFFATCTGILALPQWLAEGATSAPLPIQYADHRAGKWVTLTVHRKAPPGYWFAIDRSSLQRLTVLD